MQQTDFTSATLWLEEVKNHGRYTKENAHRVEYVECELKRAVIIHRIARCCSELQELLQQDDAPRTVRMIDVSRIHGVQLPQQVREGNESMIRASMRNFLGHLHDTCTRLPGNLVVGVNTDGELHTMCEYMVDRLMHANEIASDPSPEQCDMDVKGVINDMLRTSFQKYVVPSIIAAKQYIAKDVNCIKQVHLSCSKLDIAGRRRNNEKAMETWWNEFGRAVVTKAMDGFERMYSIGAVQIDQDISKWRLVDKEDRRQVIAWLHPVCLEIKMACDSTLDTMQMWMKSDDRSSVWRCTSLCKGSPKRPRNDVVLPLQPPSYIGAFSNDARLYVSTFNGDVLCKKEHIIPQARLHYVVAAIFSNNNVDIGCVGRNQLQPVLAIADAKLKESLGSIIENVLEPTSLACDMPRFPSAALIGW